MSTSKSVAETVLLIDDEVGDLVWLVDRIEWAGYKFVCATNEQDARRRLRAVADGEERYVLAVIDVMMATHDILQVQLVDEKFFKSSKDSGIRLCRYAREELGIRASELPIAVFTARTDDEVKRKVGAIADVELFFRDGAEGDGSLDQYVSDMLRRGRATEPSESEQSGEKP